MNITARIVAVMGTVFIAVATTGGAAEASSDPLAGKTYKDAEAAVAKMGATGEISTIFGDHVATDECIVATSQKARREIDSRQKTVYLMNLYCDDPVANAGSPGNSAASPAGKVGLKDVKTGKWCSKPAQADNHNCAKFCPKHDGLCTANF